MQTSELFPPGRIWWALRDSDLQAANRLSSESGVAADKLRLFEVLDPEKVFSQIVFSTDMLR